MKTLNWRHTDWSARNFIFSVGQEIIGQLTFNSYWNSNAVYTDKDTNLKFAQKSFWDGDVLVTKDGKAVAKIDFGLLGTQTLQLLSGEKFTLSTSFWEQEVYWKNAEGKTIIKYQQATMSSMGKGLISLNESVTIEMEKLLVGSGIFARQLRRKRAALIIVIMLPIITASRRL
jgi:hypothetical protein